jgi:hypothetical protein
VHDDNRQGIFMIRDVCDSLGLISGSVGVMSGSKANPTVGGIVDAVEALEEGVAENEVET